MAQHGDIDELGRLALLDQATDPAASSGSALLYGKDVAAVARPFGRRDDGRVIELDDSHELELDPAGADDGYTYTTYAGVFAAALELVASGGEVRILVASDVTVASGSFVGAGKITFVGNPPGSGFANPVIRFTGTATHTGVWPQFESCAPVVDAAATVAPFTAAGGFFFLSSNEGTLTVDAGSTVPLVTVSPGAFLFVLLAGVTVINPGGEPVFDITTAGSFAFIVGTVGDIGNYSTLTASAIDAVAGTTVALTNSAPINAFADPDAGVAGTLTTEARGSSKSSAITATATLRWANDYITILGGGNTFTIDTSVITVVPGNYFEFNTNFSAGAAAAADNTIVLTGGDTFLGGGTTRTLHMVNGHYRMTARSTGEWALESAYGPENSDYGRRWADTHENTGDATPTTMDARPVSALSPVVMVAANVVAQGPGSPTFDMARYRIDAVVKNEAGVLTVLQNKVTVLEDVAGWDVNVVAVGTNVEVQVTGIAATTIAWRAVIEYTDVSP